MPYPNYHGRTRYWTRERILDGLARAAVLISGPLPCSDADYNSLKSGRLDWPPARRVLQAFGSMARAWLAVGGITGASNWGRISLGNIDWTPDEDAFLLEYAGTKNLVDLADHLGRTYPAVRKRLQALGITARSNQGLLSAGELARLINCSYSRVIDLCGKMVIPAVYNQRLHRWEIDLTMITPEVRARLLAERRTHKTWELDRGDYYRRYNLRRTIRDGRVKVVCDG